MNSIDNQAGPTPTTERIVSVNDYGPAKRGWIGKLVSVAVIIVIAVVGVAHTAQRMLARQRATQAAGAEQAKAARQPELPAKRRTFPELATAGAATAPAPAAASGAECSDGTLPTPMLARDGTPILAPSGLPVRLCSNGQILMPPLPTPDLAQSPPAARASPAAIAPAASPALADKYDGDLVLPAPPAPSEASVAAGGVAVAPAAPPPVPDAPADSRGPLHAMLKSAHAKAAQASLMGNRHLTLSLGRSIDCNLSLRVVSQVSGLAVCVLPSYVYGDSGVAALAEPGSVVTGDYVALSDQGQRRLFIVWNHLKTTKGVEIDIDSPAADALGTSGLDGYLDNRWADRIGAAVLLSSVQDVVSYETARAASSNNGNSATGIAVFPQTTRGGTQLAERILDSTINIKPTIYKHQGDRATISVARDLDFGSVYELRPR